MATVTISSDEFDRNPRAAMKAADQGPVLITDQGRPGHVLLSIEAYERLSGRAHDTVKRLQMAQDVSFEPQRANIISRPVEF